MFIIESTSEKLGIFDNIYGVKTKILKKRVYLLEKVNLIDVQDNLVETYSTGMKRKLMLALIHNQIFCCFADELLNGLDPESCVGIYKYID